MGRRALLSAVLGTLAAGAAAGQGSEPPAAEVLAERFRTAFESEEAPAREEWLGPEAPDPFLVADALFAALAGGEVQADAWRALDAWCELAATLPENAALPALLARWRGLDAEGRARERALRERLAGAPGGTPDAELVVALAESLPSVPRVLLLAERANALRLAGRGEEAAAGFEEAAAAALDLGWIRKAAHALHSAGILHYRAGRFERALDAWEREVALHESVGNGFGLALALASIADALEVTGRYRQALEQLDRAEEHCDGDRHPSLDAHLHNGRALLLGRLGDLPGAEASYRRALDGFERAGDDRGLAATLSNLGALQRARGELDAALESIERAAALREGLGDAAGAARTRAGLGPILAQLHQPERALALYLEAAAAAEKTQGGGKRRKNESMKAFARRMRQETNQILIDSVKKDQTGYLKRKKYLQGQKEKKKRQKTKRKTEKK